MDPSAQLQNELQSAVRRALDARRPLLHHLNADTSWLLQLPRPSFRRSSISIPTASRTNQTSPSSHKRLRTKPSTQSLRPARAYYNILIDPWFTGGQSDVAAWFSQQFHAEKSSVGHIREVEALAKEMETLAGAEDVDDDRHEKWIDLVVISHEFTDHCHKDTLFQIDPNVPVFASDGAADLVISWDHFRQVTKHPKLRDSNSDLMLASVPPLPDWVSITWLENQTDALYYHSAVVIAFTTPDSTEAETVVYTPHGLHPTTLRPLLTASPPVQPLALLHGLHDVRLAPGLQQLNLGGVNAVDVVRSLRPKFWAATHDEVKKGGGLVSWLLRRTIWNIEDIFSDRVAPKQSEDDVWKQQWHDILRQTAFINLGNGASCML